MKKIKSSCLGLFLIIPIFYYGASSIMGHSYAKPNNNTQSVQFLDQLLEKARAIKSRPESERAKALGQLFSQNFDIEAGAKRTGRWYNKASASDKNRFLKIYKARIIKQYGTNDKLDKFLGYKSNSKEWKVTKINPNTETIRAIFKSITGSHPDIPIEATILSQNGTCLIQDVKIEGVSMTTQNAEEFKSIRAHHEKDFLIYLENTLKKELQAIQ